MKSYLVLACAALLGALQAQGAEEPASGTEVGQGELRYGSAGASPAGRFHVKDLFVSGFYGQSFIVDDNAFLTESGGDSEVSYVATPGVRVDFLPGNLTLGAEYRADVQTYFGDSDAGRTNHFLDAQGKMSVGKFYLAGGERFAMLSDPADLLLNRRVDRTENIVSALGGFRDGRLTLEAGYQHHTTDFEATTLQHGDVEVDTVTGYLDYRLNPRWDAVVMYTWGERDYEENILADNHFNELTGGLRGFLTPKLEIYGRVGGHWVENERGSRTGDDNNISTVSAMVSGKYKWNPRLTVSATYLRSSETSTYAAYEVFNDVEGQITYQMTRDVRLGFLMFLRDVNPSRGPRRDQWGFRFGAEWKVRRWLSVTAEGLFRYQNSSAVFDELVDTPDGVTIHVGDATADFSDAQFILASLIVF